MKQFIKNLGNELQVNVGVPRGAGVYEDGLTIATIAAVNEFGTEDGRIPARPFLRPAIEENTAVYLRIVERDLPEILAGKQPMTRLLHRLGNLATGHVQRKIVDGPFTPNAPSTIRAKGSSSPLIDTGALRQSINYEIFDNREPVEEGLQTVSPGGFISRIINKAKKIFGRSN